MQRVFNFIVAALLGALLGSHPVGRYYDYQAAKICSIEADRVARRFETLEREHRWLRAWLKVHRHEADGAGGGAFRKTRSGGKEVYGISTEDIGLLEKKP